MEAYDISKRHGKTMYYLGMKHTVELVDILIGSVPKELTERLEGARIDAEEADREAEACND